MHNYPPVIATRMETPVSLVIAFIGAHGAAMGGDRREVITRGDRIMTETLEHELYSGQIVTDEALIQRAQELGVLLTIRDDKRKITQRDGVLVGEVSEAEGGVTKKRRLYATGGGYALAEITNGEIRVSGKGRASTFVVLGNQVTQDIAHSFIRENWKNGTLHDAIRIIVLSMQRATATSASVSGSFDLIQTQNNEAIDTLIEHDCRNNQ